MQSYASVLPSAVLDITAAYDPAAEAVTLTLGGADFSFLLQLAEFEVASAFGVELPGGEPVRSTTPSAATATIVASSYGIEEITVGLPGTWTLASLAARFKVEFPGADDLVTVTNPSLVYTTLPVALGATMEVAVPALGVTGAVATLALVPGGGGVELKVRGGGGSEMFAVVCVCLVMQHAPERGPHAHAACCAGRSQHTSPISPPPLWQLHGTMTPVRGITLSEVTLTASKAGLVGTASGRVGDLPVSVQVSVSKADGLELIISASDVPIGGMLAAALPSEVAPAGLVAFLEPVRFASVMLVYHKGATSRTPFVLTASPDMSTLPALRDAIVAVGLQPSDVALRTSGAGTLEFSVAKSVVLDLGSPVSARARMWGDALCEAA